MLPNPLQTVEQIRIEKHSQHWMVMSSSGCGILASAVIGRHWMQYHEGQRRGLAFASAVLQAMHAQPPQAPSLTPHLLLDSADTLIDDPKRLLFMCTTWQYLEEGVEICSIGTNTVLTMGPEGSHVVIAPHSVNEILKSEGQAPHRLAQYQITRALGSSNCTIEDIRTVLVPFTPGTTLVMVIEPFFGDALLDHPVSTQELDAFVGEWNTDGRKNSSYVQISW